MAIRHKLDKTGRAASIGFNAENSFEAAARKAGYTVTKSGKREDIFEHWDFLLEKDGFKHKVEVKGQKGFMIRDDNGQLTRDFFLVEFVGVTGHAGWIYGKADFIAFERFDGFYLFTRKLVLDTAKALCSNKWVDYREDMLHNIYGRRDRQDEVTALSVNELLATRKFAFIKK